MAVSDARAVRPYLTGIAECEEMESGSRVGSTIKEGMQTCHHLACLHALKDVGRFTFFELIPEDIRVAYRATNAVMSRLSGSIRCRCVSPWLPERGNSGPFVSEQAFQRATFGPQSCNGCVSYSIGWRFCSPLPPSGCCRKK